MSGGTTGLLVNWYIRAFLRHSIVSGLRRASDTARSKNMKARVDRQRQTPSRRWIQPSSRVFYGIPWRTPRYTSSRRLSTSKLGRGLHVVRPPISRQNMRRLLDAAGPKRWSRLKADTMTENCDFGATGGRVSMGGQTEPGGSFHPNKIQSGPRERAWQRQGGGD